MTLREVEALIGAAASGTLRRGTKDGDNDRAGEPLSVQSLDGLLSALPYEHLAAGQSTRWAVGAHEEYVARQRGRQT